MSQKKEPQKPRPVSPSDESIKFTPLPEELQFFLDDKGQVWATVKGLGYRRFRLESELVTSIMYSTLMKAYRHKPSKDNLQSYFHRARKTALDAFLARPDKEDIILESNTLVMGALIFMHRLFHSDGDETIQWTGSLENLREKLEGIRKEKGWAEEWPKGNWFRPYLEDQKQQLRENNLELSFGERENWIRPVVLRWIDKEKVPEWKGLVVRPE